MVKITYYGFRVILKKKGVELVHMCLHKDKMRGIVTGAVNLLVPQLVRNVLTS